MWKPALRPYVRYAQLRCTYPAHPLVIDNKIVGELRDLSYIEQWNLCRANSWYHIYLEDHCFFSFQTHGKPSYAFFDSPLDLLTMREFVAEQGLALNQDSYARLQSEYSDYIATASLKEHCTPIRYDFDTGAYRAGVHPAGHIHIGLNNEIRLGLRRELTPIAFFLFVIRQMYPQNWEHLLRSTQRAVLPKRIRDHLNEVGALYQQAEDECELQLV